MFVSYFYVFLYSFVAICSAIYFQIRDHVNVVKLSIQFIECDTPQ